MLLFTGIKKKKTIEQCVVLHRLWNKALPLVIISFILSGLLSVWVDMISGHC